AVTDAASAVIPGAPVSKPGAGSNHARKLAEAQEKARRQTDGADFPVLPDCCNIGTVVRVLLVVNVGAAAMLLVSSGGLVSALSGFLRSALLVEPAAIGSLIILCPLRKLVNGTPRLAQWVTGLGVPFAVTLVVALIVSSFLVPDLSGTALIGWMVSRAIVAAVVAAALIEWLYLRTLSLQPSQAEGRLQALQARIRPHFLFNSLNTVLGLMRSNPRQAETTLENLSDLFRVFMKDSRELVPLDEEVLLCKEYLSIEKLRLDTRLEVAWHIEDMPGDALLPSLLLQPLIENAVHHGIEPRSETGLIDITIAKHGERIRADIVNPIAESAPTKKGNQMALSNIRERLSLTFDVEGHLVTTTEDGLFRATVTFPYRKERRRRDVRPNLDTNR
ncbi:MAG: histidine kinase, partial [Burkholderiaceae bacterium]